MIIKGAKVFEQDATWSNRNIFIEDRLIANKASGDILDASGLIAIPGLIDIHFHGCMGYDFCDGSEEAIRAMARYELSEGITTICPASMTYDEERLGQSYDCAKLVRDSQSKKEATIVGINMEGPFISYEKRGAQNPEFIHKPDSDMFRRLQARSGNMVKLLDMAPEAEGAMECIDRLHNEVRISIAHTTADYGIAREAIKRGARQLTHTYNAMPPFYHREPGVIGAAYENDEVMAELICDGIHVHPSVINATFKMFDYRRMILISDSMRACGLKDGEYTLGGMNVTVNGNRATLTKEGNIAGSVTNLRKCLKYAVQTARIPFEEAVYSASVTPAKAIGIFDTVGSLDIGKKADILLCDDSMNIKYVIKDGQIN